MKFDMLHIFIDAKLKSVLRISIFLSAARRIILDELGVKLIILLMRVRCQRSEI